MTLFFFLGGVDGFRPKNRICLSENRKNAYDTNENPPYHLILLILNFSSPNIITILWCSGYGVMIQDFVYGTTVSHFY